MTRMHPHLRGQYVTWASGELPAVLLVADGVWATPIPHDGEGIAYTLCYLIEDSAGNVHVLDPGTGGAANWRMLVAALTASGHSLGNVASIVVSHLHTDHVGLATRLHHVTGAPLVVHEIERHGIITNGRVIADRLPLDGWGVPVNRRAELAPPERAPIDPAVVIEGVADGDRLDIPGRRFEAVWTPGHTSGHLSLHAPDEGMLFTGDHVLPVIRPGFGLGAPSVRNPLTEYLKSLDRVAALGDVVVHPGHEYSFVGLGERCLQLRLHHERRAAAVADALRERPHANLWTIASVGGWKGGWAELTGTRLRLALMQTAAHVERLTA